MGPLGSRRRSFAPSARPTFGAQCTVKPLKAADTPPLPPGSSEALTVRSNATRHTRDGPLPNLVVASIAAHGMLHSMRMPARAIASSSLVRIGAVVSAARSRAARTSAEMVAAPSSRSQ